MPNVRPMFASLADTGRHALGSGFGKPVTVRCDNAKPHVSIQMLRALARLGLSFDHPEVGTGTSIGAGTITSNHDCFKFKTIPEKPDLSARTATQTTDLESIVIVNNQCHKLIRKIAGGLYLFRNVETDTLVLYSALELLRLSQPNSDRRTMPHFDAAWKPKD